MSLLKKIYYYILRKNKINCPKCGIDMEHFGISGSDLYCPLCDEQNYG